MPVGDPKNFNFYKISDYSICLYFILYLKKKKTCKGCFTPERPPSYVITPPPSIKFVKAQIWKSTYHSSCTYPERVKLDLELVFSGAHHFRPSTVTNFCLFFSSPSPTTLLPLLSILIDPGVMVDYKKKARTGLAVEGNTRSKMSSSYF